MSASQACYEITSALQLQICLACVIFVTSKLFIMWQFNKKVLLYFDHDTDNFRNYFSISVKSFYNKFYSNSCSFPSNVHKSPFSATYKNFQVRFSKITLKLVRDNLTDVSSCKINIKLSSLPVN